MIASTAAELAAITDAIDRSRQRMADLAQPYVGSERDDIVTAIYEVERTLLAAQRALKRASRAVER
jgi:flavin-binding protein dodecin